MGRNTIDTTKHIHPEAHAPLLPSASTNPQRIPPSSRLSEPALSLAKGFNPFFIRSGLPTLAKGRPWRAPWDRFQSLLHQVRSSNVVGLTLSVLVTWEFQSLLHQVRSSNVARVKELSLYLQSFNPFFIRSGLPTKYSPEEMAALRESFNPFFIRSGLPTLS